MTPAAEPHRRPAPNGPSRRSPLGSGAGGPGAAETRDARVVPLYALARRPEREAGPADEVPWEAMVTATRVGTDSLSRLQFEPAQIVELCQRPVSVAEVAAHLQVPVGVARLLVTELRDEGMVTTHVPRFGGGGRPSGECSTALWQACSAPTRTRASAGPSAGS